MSESKLFSDRTPAGELIRHRRAILTNGRIEVIGRQGTRYHLHVDERGIGCSCPAGFTAETYGRETPCWHRQVAERYLRNRIKAMRREQRRTEAA